MEPKIEDKMFNIFPLKTSSMYSKWVITNSKQQLETQSIQKEVQNKERSLNQLGVNLKMNNLLNSTQYKINQKDSQSTKNWLPIQMAA